jgi:hypothetical protein
MAHPAEPLLRHSKELLYLCSVGCAAYSLLLGQKKKKKKNKEKRCDVKSKMLTLVAEDLELR